MKTEPVFTTDGETLYRRGIPQLSADPRKLLDEFEDHQPTSPVTAQLRACVRRMTQRKAA